jgi:hypothetical protein
METTKSILTVGEAKKAQIAQTAVNMHKCIRKHVVEDRLLGLECCVVRAVRGTAGLADPDMVEKVGVAGHFGIGHTRVSLGGQ